MRAPPPANSTSYDPVKDLLSTSNTVQIATLVVTVFFGILAVFWEWLTWRHQRWERQLDRDEARRLVNKTGDLESGNRDEGDREGNFAMEDFDTQSDDDTVIEGHSQGTRASSASSALSILSTPATGSSSVVFPHGSRNISSPNVEISEHIGNSGSLPQAATNTKPENVEQSMESDSIVFSPNQTIPDSQIDGGELAIEDSVIESSGPTVESQASMLIAGAGGTSGTNYNSKLMTNETRRR